MNLDNVMSQYELLFIVTQINTFEPNLRANMD